MLGLRCEFLSKGFMVHDIFFDCPQCSHTIKVSSDLVGVKVECPDCANEFRVPDIRDGLRPRLRSQVSAELSMNQTTHRDLMEDLVQLEQGLRGLMRRQLEQIKQIDFIEGKSNLLLRQLRLLELPPVRELPEEEGTGISSRETDSPSKPMGGWLRWSMICGWLTLGMALLFGILLLRTR